jgi:hypothetical protein
MGLGNVEVIENCRGASGGAPLTVFKKAGLMSAATAPIRFPLLPGISRRGLRAVPAFPSPRGHGIAAFRINDGGDAFPSPANASLVHACPAQLF